MALPQNISDQFDVQSAALRQLLVDAHSAGVSASAPGNINLIVKAVYDPDSNSILSIGGQLDIRIGDTAAYSAESQANWWRQWGNRPNATVIDLIPSDPNA